MINPDKFILYRKYMQRFLCIYHSYGQRYYTRQKIKPGEPLYIYAEHIDNYFREWAICLWVTAEETDIEKCCEALNNTYIFEWQKRTYSKNQVKIILANSHMMKYDNANPGIPSFFEKMMTKDLKDYNTNIKEYSRCSRFFVNSFKSLMDMYSLNDGLLTNYKQIVKLNEIEAKLINMCDDKGLPDDSSESYSKLVIASEFNDNKKRDFRFSYNYKMEKERREQNKDNIVKYSHKLLNHYRDYMGTLIDSCYSCGDLHADVYVDSINRYFRTCAMYYWKTKNLSAEECLDVINEIYIIEKDKCDYTIDRLRHEMNDDSYTDAKAGGGIISDLSNIDAWCGTAYCTAFIGSVLHFTDMFAIGDNEILSVDDVKIILDYHEKKVLTQSDYGTRRVTNNDPYCFLNIIKDFVVISDEDRIEYMKGNKNICKIETLNIEELLNSFDKLIGLEKVKKDIKELVNVVKVQKTRKERELKTTTMSLHLVFTGNPGIGKTTVARLIAKIYKQLGILSRGQLIEAGRSDLVAGYVGQTAIKTQEVLESALGGILFIDEAYTLAADKGSNFGQEAINTILKYMEDNRDNLIIIVAGYEKLMQEFIDSNPGLKSRFNKYILFEDYCGSEMFSIFKLFCEEGQYNIDDTAAELLSKYFDDLFENRDENFGNARDVRNLFENMITMQSNRIVEYPDISNDELTTFIVSDVTEALKRNK